MIIAFGCDHSFYDSKNVILNFLKSKNFITIDCGADSNCSTHYAIYGHKVATLVSQGKANFGIVICGTGIGISNAAQKTKGARVVSTQHIIVAKKARELYDANILGIGGRIVGENLLLELIDVFLSTQYLQANINVISKINKLIEIDNFNGNIFDEIIDNLENDKY